LISFVRIPALAIGQHIWPLPPLGILDEDRLEMRAWPNNIDFNMHMNNARYLSIMDYGRMHLLARAQIFSHIIRLRWTPTTTTHFVPFRDGFCRLQRPLFRGHKGGIQKRLFPIQQPPRPIASDGLRPRRLRDCERF
jgi:hypothetical protein